MTINSISCKLIEKKGKKAEIEIEGQRIIIPSENLPNDIGDGGILEISFSNQKIAKMKEKELARTILEEILNGG